MGGVSRCNGQGSGVGQDMVYIRGNSRYEILRRMCQNWSAKVSVAGSSKGCCMLCCIEKRVGGGHGFVVCVQWHSRLVTEVAPPWVAHVEWGGGASRFLGANAVGKGEGGCRTADSLSLIALGGGRQCWGGPAG